MSWYDLEKCQNMYNDVISLAPTDGSLAALEYGLELAREGLDFMEDKKCGLTDNNNAARPDLSCAEGRTRCPLKNILDM